MVPQYGRGNGGIGENHKKPLCQCPKPAEGVGTGTHKKTDGTETHKKERLQRGRQKEKKRRLGEGIFNLTDVVFTQEELLVLDSGIKYAPSKPFNQFEAFIDLQKCIRKLNLKKHFFRKRREYYTTG